MEKIDEMIALRALAALAQPHRLRIHRLLVEAAPVGLTPGEIADALALASPTLSFHLKELAGAGLVDAERDGRHILYRARLNRMTQLLGYLTENCCAGQACDAVPTQPSSVEG